MRGCTKLAVCLQFIHVLEMHKRMDKLFYISNTLTYRSCVLFLHKVMVCARQRGILNKHKFV